MDGPQQRASDEDRQRVVRDLERHTAAGRLTLDEYAERVDRALASRTHGQLAEVFLIALAALVVVLGLVALKH